MMSSIESLLQLARVSQGAVESTRLQLDAEEVNAWHWQDGTAIIPLGQLGLLDVEEVIKNNHGHNVAGNLLTPDGVVSRASLDLRRRGLLGRLLNRAVEATVCTYPERVSQSSVNY